MSDVYQSLSDLVRKCSKHERSGVALDAFAVQLACSLKTFGSQGDRPEFPLQARRFPCFVRAENAMRMAPVAWDQPGLRCHGPRE